MTNTQALLIHETPAASVACDMTTATDTPEERLAEYGRLFAEALIDRQRTEDAVVFVFAAKPGIAEQLAELARREALCCPFASYQVTVEGGRVVWRTSSQAGSVARAILDEFYALPEQIGQGIDGLLARLAERGIAITASVPGHYAGEKGARAAGLLARLKAGCGC